MLFYGTLMEYKLDQLFIWITPGYDGFEALLQAATSGFNMPLATHDLDFIRELKPVTQTIIDELGLPAYLKRFKKARDPEDHIKIRRLDKTKRITNLWAYIVSDGKGNECFVRSGGIYVDKNVPLITTVGRYAAEMMREAQEAMKGMGLEWRLVRFELAEYAVMDRLEPIADKSEEEANIVRLKRGYSGTN
jgi:hypothetical protein